MRAQQLAVVGREHDDGLVGQAQPVELVEQLHDLLVDVADGVEIVVLARPHAPFVVGDQARQIAVGLMVDAMRGHAARPVERLLPGVLQRDAVPLLLVERILGRKGNGELRLLGLHGLAGLVGVDPHHVVRIDEVDGEVPGLLAVGHRPAHRLQPLAGLCAGDLVVLIAAQRALDEVAGAGVVEEAVVLVHHGLEQRLDVVGVVLGGHGAVQVPLALVGSVVAELAQDLADGRQLGAEALLVRHAGIVEDAVQRLVKPGIDRRPRRRAHVGGDMVVLEERRHAAQPFAARQREGPRIAHVLFLVGQDEQHVVAAVVRTGCVGRGEARFAAASDARGRSRSGRRRLRHGRVGRDGGACSRDAGLDNGTTSGRQLLHLKGPSRCSG